MGKIVYHGREYSSDGEAVVNVDFNDSGYSKDEIDEKLANSIYSPTNKDTLDKISEDTTDVKATFNGKNLAYEDDIDTKLSDGLTDYIKKSDALTTFATNSLMTSTISDVAVLKSRLDNINDDVAPTNYYTKDEIKDLLASAEVGALVQFDSLTTEQKEQLKGEKGDKGNKGETGNSAYQDAVELGYTGTKEDWLESLKGKDAYEIAVEEGYAYTRDAWLQSLKGEKGEKGDTGETGKSAYQIAVENGLTSASTQADWIAELKGEKGDSIVSVEQTTTSTENEGVNVITCTLSTGTTSEFNIKNGAKGESITSVEQTTTSTDDDGINVVTCTLSTGTTSTFNIKNGSKGDEGYALLPTEEPADLRPGRIWLA